MSQPADAGQLATRLETRQDQGARAVSLEAEGGDQEAPKSLRRRDGFAQPQSAMGVLKAQVASIAPIMIGSGLLRTSSTARVSLLFANQTEGASCSSDGHAADALHPRGPEVRGALHRGLERRRSRFPGVRRAVRPEGTSANGHARVEARPNHAQVDAVMPAQEKLGYTKDMFLQW